MKLLGKIFFLLSFVFLLSAGLASAQSVATTSQPEALWYYKEEPRSRESFFKHADKIDVLGPQTYFLKSGGVVIGSVKQDVLDNAKQENMKVMPLVANIIILKNGKEYFDMSLMSDLLSDTRNWEKFAKTLRNEGKKYGYYGWQLDLEHIKLEDKEKFIQFVTYLKGELAKDNLKLSAAIVSKISDYPEDYTPTYWREWAGAYDYERLGKVLDFVSVMAYDQPNGPGPVATIDWSKKVMNYTLTKIPKEKVSFGIPTYSWAYRSVDLKNKKSHFRMVDYGLVQTWINQSEKQKIIKLSAEGYRQAYQKYWATGTGSSSVFGGQTWVSYNYNGVNYTIWAENAESFQRKLDNIKQAGLRGYSAWVLGDEDPRVWEVR
jgi:spore germination protein YaaH